MIEQNQINRLLVPRQDIYKLYSIPHVVSYIAEIIKCIYLKLNLHCYTQRPGAHGFSFFFGT